MEEKEKVTIEQIYELIGNPTRSQPHIPFVWPKERDEHFNNLRWMLPSTQRNESWINGDRWVDNDPQLKRLLSALD